MDPISICLAIDHLRAGGAQEVVFQLARGLASRGHTVSTISLGSADAYEERFAESGLALHVLGYRRSSSLACARSLRSIVAKLNPQIVQSFLFKADMLTRSALTGAQRPRLASSIQWGSGSRVWWQSKAYRFTAGRSDFVVAVSEDSRRFAIDELGAAPARTRIIRNAVDLKQFTHGYDRSALRQMLEIPADAFTIVSVGRLVPIKSYDVLVQSFATIADRIPGARLVIVGDGDLYDQLAAEAAPMGERVWLPGYRKDAWKFAGAADVFVSSSRSEGSSTALLEAMAQGAPVVATDAAGNNEIVEHAQNGLLVPWNDSRALASALNLLYKDRDLASRLGRAAREWVETKHSAEKMTADYESVYHEMLKSGCSSRIDSQETRV